MGRRASLPAPPSPCSSIRVLRRRLTRSASRCIRRCQVRRLRPDLPIVLTSGYPQRVPAADQRGLAEFHFIPKPYRVADVAAQVRAIRNAAAPGISE